MSQYNIKLNYSECTLDSLTYPMRDNKNGCQFNKSDIKENKTCPVCKQTQINECIFDQSLFIQLYEEQIRQQIVSNQKQELRQMNRTPYTNHNISKNQKFKELQLKSQSSQKQHYKIEDLFQNNMKYNKELQQQLLYFPQEHQIPLLFGVLDYQLIVFFHTFKLKVQFDLFDFSKKIVQLKVSYQKHGELISIYHFNKQLYFLFNNQNIYEIYIGDVQQIFNPQSQLGQFCIRSLLFKIQIEGSNIPIFFIKQNNLFITDGQNCKQLNDQFDNIQQLNIPIITQQRPNEIQNYKFIPKTSVISECNDSILICFPQLMVIEAQKNKPQNLSRLMVKEINFKLNKFNEYSLQQEEIFDTQFICGGRQYLFKLEDLQKTTFKAFTPLGKGQVPLINHISVTNQVSYMKPIKIITTQANLTNLTCFLIGLELPQKIKSNEHKIFPAIAVFNNKNNSIEIELI